MRVQIGSVDPQPLGGEWYDWILEPFVWLGEKIAEWFGMAFQSVRQVAILGLAVFVAVVLLVRGI